MNGKRARMIPVSPTRPHMIRSRPEGDKAVFTCSRKSSFSCFNGNYSAIAPIHVVLNHRPAV